MLNRVVQFFPRRFIFLVLALSACGSVTQSKNNDLAVSLALPAGEDPSLFWFGVAHKTLRAGDAVVDWQEGQHPALSLREGDKLEFFGADDGGRVLVQGEAVVSGEKSLSIPVRRVL